MIFIDCALSICISELFWPIVINEIDDIIFDDDLYFNQLYPIVNLDDHIVLDQ